MKLDRRGLLTSLAATPALLTAGCALASEDEWPGPVTPGNELPRLPIGMNLAGIADWETGFPFRNLMWGARKWMSRNAFGGGPWNTEQAPYFEYDQDGYPLEVPLTTPGSAGVPQHLFTIVPNVRTAGRYVLLYDGEGSFDASLGTRIISQRPGKIVLQMTHREGLVEVIAIRKSVRGNHIRNIRILAQDEDPATLAEQPFLPEFLDFCRPFHALRFMDWGATNNSIEESWAERRKPSFYTMVGGSGDADGLWKPKPTSFERMYAGGVSHELMILLANTLDVDVWICIPHRANDEYIRQCAALYRNGLLRNQRVYVEFSNEIWNWQFLQASWMLQSKLAGEIVERRGSRAWEEKDGKLNGVNHPERMGALFSRAFRLWRQGWGDADAERVVTVCAIQAAWADASVRTIEWCLKDGSTDAIAASGYFGPGDTEYTYWAERGSQLTGADVIRSMWHVVERQGLKGNLLRYAVIAKNNGLRYVTYEGGQHIQPKNQQQTPYMPALSSAQNHPQMYELYIENLRQQLRIGCSLFCAFSSVGTQGARTGSWGSKSSYTAPNTVSPKYRALLDCNADRSSQSPTT